MWIVVGKRAMQFVAITLVFVGLLLACNENENLEWYWNFIVVGMMFTGVYTGGGYKKS